MAVGEIRVPIKALPLIEEKFSSPIGTRTEIEIKINPQVRTGQKLSPSLIFRSGK